MYCMPQLAMSRLLPWGLPLIPQEVWSTPHRRHAPCAGKGSGFTAFKLTTDRSHPVGHGTHEYRYDVSAPIPTIRLSFRASSFEHLAAIDNSFASTLAVRGQLDAQAWCAIDLSLPTGTLDRASCRQWLTRTMLSAGWESSS